MIGSGFKNIIDKYLSGGSLPENSVKSNLLFMYKLRNKIVHNKFRIKPMNGWICFKAISTVKYLIFSPLNTTNRRAAIFVSKMELQFLGLQDFAGAWNLDDIERKFSNIEKINDAPMVTSNEEFDKIMFTALEFTAEERSKVLIG
jgi:hypothetical protein